MPGLENATSRSVCFIFGFGARACRYIPRAIYHRRRQTKAVALWEKCILRRRERINLRPNCHFAKLLWALRRLFVHLAQGRAQGRTDGWASEAKTRPPRLLSPLHTSVHRQELFTRRSQAVNHKRFSKETSRVHPLVFLSCAHRNFTKRFIS